MSASDKKEAIFTSYIVLTLTGTATSFRDKDLMIQTENGGGDETQHFLHPCPGASGNPRTGNNLILFLCFFVFETKLFCCFFLYDKTVACLVI